MNVLKWAAAVLVVAAVGAQFVRVEQTNPPTDPGHALRAQLGSTSGLATVVDRACRDCHSNDTVWPTAWYTRVAPVSWAITSGVAEGRRVVNFSEWTTYPAAAQQTLLAASCQAATDGTMPGSAWTFLHPEARLTPADIETICSAARDAGVK